ncbi:MAG: CHAT domain-containing protein [Candidatus Brocadia sp. WS118]|nr:MAG: CHAT domain-containing protein [Candidatus Brocadia sp. WS118]
MAANPKETTRLRIDKEMREIDHGIRLAKHRDLFMLKYKPAVQIEDIRRELLYEEPNIVHFSGHSGIKGIIVEDQSGNAVKVNPEGLSTLFKILADKIICVLLNSCFSESQARAINKHIPYVIGMRENISDEAAIEFSIGFYDSLAASNPLTGKMIERAFELGRNAIQLKSLPKYLVPVLYAKGKVK